jgi:hypothetical protein
MSVATSFRAIFAKFAWLLTLMVSFSITACAEEQEFVDTVREFTICPPEDVAESVSTLRLEEDRSLTIPQLRDRVAGLGYNFERSRYGIGRYSCVPGEISPDTDVLVIGAGFDPSNTYVREFYILADEFDVVIQIELRKVRLGP